MFEYNFLVYKEIVKTHLTHKSQQLQFLTAVKSSQSFVSLIHYFSCLPVQK